MITPLHTAIGSVLAPAAIALVDRLADGLDFGSLLRRDAAAPAGEAAEGAMQTLPGLTTGGGRHRSIAALAGQLQKLRARMEIAVSQVDPSHRLTVRVRADGFGQVRVEGAGSDRAPLEALLNGDPEFLQAFHGAFGELSRLEPEVAVDAIDGLTIDSLDRATARFRADDSANLLDFTVGLSSEGVRVNLT